MFNASRSPVAGIVRSALLGFALLAGNASVALAATPTIERVAIDLDARLNTTSDLICGFDVWQHVAGTVLVQSRTDRSGAVTERDVIPGQFESTFYSRDSTGLPTGKELTAHTAGTQTVTVSIDGSFVYRESGTHDRITLSGSGVIMGSIGHLVDVYDASTGEEIVDVAGTHEITFESLAHLCDPLRP